MTNSVEDLIKEVSYLKKTVSSLQEELRDHRASQLKINAHFQTHLDLYRTKEKQLHWSIKCVKYLLNKMKESDIRMDTLMKVLGGRIENTVCKCGEQFSVFQREESSNSHDEEAISQSKQQHENISGNLKCQQGQAAHNSTKKVSKSIQTEQTKQTTKSKKKPSKLIQTDQDVKGNFINKANQTKSIEFVTYSTDLTTKHFYGGEKIEFLLPGKSWVFVATDDCKQIIERDSHFMSRETEIWRDIMAGYKDCILTGKPIQLPEEFGSFIVQINMASLNNQMFSIKVCLVNNSQNRSLPLPLKFKLFVKIENTPAGAPPTNSNNKLAQFKHEFKLAHFYPEYGPSNKFNIPISNQLDKKERPYMMFKFCA